ncbi:cation:proton antiporter [Cypionkella aquatica]|uniref:Cation:proton antiporter n=1 Tax=Cypionkella aquatica TaxID=1756042 RepID=A0AA37U6C0_9RHOB|nr:monovalent cation/H(+) antiporter subunit G [Cypionkella aquatica]GLS88073.1 cation:proton antiporter [Cypionkella aquatica]GLS88434.1 cation:proton antiporter [Cypionkella aquatica]
MSHLETVPLWLAIPVGLLLVLGSGLTLLGTIGLVQLKSFYDRLHAPTLGTGWGMAAIVLASILLFSWLEGRPSLHEAVIAVFVMITTPVTMMMLGRAALHRDRKENAPELPEIARRTLGEDTP